MCVWPKLAWHVKNCVAAAAGATAANRVAAAFGFSIFSCFFFCVPLLLSLLFWLFLLVFRGHEYLMKLAQDTCNALRLCRICVHPTAPNQRLSHVFGFACDTSLPSGILN